MTTGPRTEYGIRLEKLLDELGYRKEGRIDFDRAAMVINKRTLKGGLMDGKALKALCRASKPSMWTCDVVKRVSAGIGVDVRELLYDEAPKPGRRPANLFDELERLFPVD